MKKIAHYNAWSRCTLGCGQFFEMLYLNHQLQDVISFQFLQKLKTDDILGLQGFKKKL